MDSYCYLTTVDNPYSPITQFDEWLAYDTQKGYNTCGFLNRTVESSEVDYSSLTQEEQSLLVVRTIHEIVKENVLGLYKVIYA